MKIIFKKYTYNICKRDPLVLYNFFCITRYNFKKLFSPKFQEVIRKLRKCFALLKRGNFKITKGLVRSRESREK